MTHFRRVRAIHCISVLILAGLFSMTVHANPFDAKVGITPYRSESSVSKAPVKATVLPGQWLLRGFQIWLSPQDGAVCRFRPTCSRYSQIAIQKYGLLIGSIMTADRLIRDNPFHPPGRDPVP